MSEFTKEQKSAPGEIRVVNEKTGGEKASKLERYDLIPSDGMDEVARVYGMGASKYAARNWERGYDWGLSIAAMERHISLFKQREDVDRQSGLSHMAHVVFHALALMRFAKTCPDLDDRSRS